MKRHHTIYCNFLNWYSESSLLSQIFESVLFYFGELIDQNHPILWKAIHPSQLWLGYCQVLNLCEWDYLRKVICTNQLFSWEWRWQCFLTLRAIAWVLGEWLMWGLWECSPFSPSQCRIVCWSLCITLFQHSQNPTHLSHYLDHYLSWS